MTHRSSILSLEGLRAGAFHGRRASLEAGFAKSSPCLRVEGARTLRRIRGDRVDEGRRMAMSHRFLGGAFLAQLLLLLLTLGARPSHAADSLWVEAELQIRGHHLFSTAMLRRMLHAGHAQSLEQWQARADSLAALYAREARPFLDLRWTVDSTGQRPRLMQLELEEGPQLILGQLRVDGLEEGMPSPLRDLPPRRVLRQGVLEEGLREWLSRLDQQGMALASVQVTDFTLVPEGEDQVALDLVLRLTHGGILRPGPLLAQGNMLTRTLTLERLTGLQEGESWSPTRVAEARRRLMATGWFRTVSGPGLCRTPQGLRWHVRVEEAPAYRFDGLAAWLPDRSGRGRWGYHVNLELANLLGTGRELAVLASRPEGWSQDLHLRYTEPFLGGLPLSASLSLRQRVQDSTWVEQRVTGSLRWQTGQGLSLGVAVEGAVLSPDSLNGYLGAGMDASRLWEGRMEVELDRRDEGRNPRKGWQASLQEARVRRSYRPLGDLPARHGNLDLRRQHLRAAAYLPFGSFQVLQVGGGAGRVTGPREPGMEDLMALGGVWGPRGSREESLRSREWVLVQGEWRLLLGPASRAALFWDMLRWWDRGLEAHTTQGRGAALVLPVRQGQLDLQYALPLGARWREGLLHVRLVTRF